MSDALASWLSQAQFDVPLDDGPVVTMHLPNLTDCVIAGDIPLPVLDKLKKQSESKGKADSALSTEELAHVRRFNVEAVRQSIDAVNGESVRLSAEDVKRMPPEHYERLRKIALREEPVPGKAG